MSLIKKYRGNDVDAVQLTKENAEEVAKWVDGKVTTKTFEVENEDGTKVSVEKLRVNITPHKPGAWRFGTPGDWFVKDDAGTVRIFPPVIFPKIFTEVEDQAPSLEGEGLFE